MHVLVSVEGSVLQSICFSLSLFECLFVHVPVSVDAVIYLFSSLPGSSLSLGLRHIA